MTIEEYIDRIKPSKRAYFIRNMGIVAAIGFPYECHRDFTHIRIMLDGIKVDLWPTTGTWKTNKGDLGRDFTSLERYISNYISLGAPND